MLHGAIAWLVAVPMILVLAALGSGGYFGRLVFRSGRLSAWVARAGQIADVADAYAISRNNALGAWPHATWIDWQRYRRLDGFGRADVHLPLPLSWPGLVLCFFNPVRSVKSSRAPLTFSLSIGHLTRKGDHHEERHSLHLSVVDGRTPFGPYSALVHRRRIPQLMIRHAEGEVWNCRSCKAVSGHAHSLTPSAGSRNNQLTN